VTNARVMINLFHNEDFIFRNPSVLTDRFDGRENYFSASNFIPNVREFELQEWKDRGAGGSNINFEMAHNSMAAHASEFPVGTYKKAHRHGPGAHVVILTGEGYSLMWPDGEEKIKIDWQVGSVIVLPNRWFHQHFNTGKTPARYLALRRGGPARFRPAAQKKATEPSVKLGGDQIEHEDEDPAIRTMFEEAVGRHGGVSKMDRFFPR
jgi:oxalate decarboxylase/phosphoglucose isomerase-like protein (cupin superfamily)